MAFAYKIYDQYGAYFSGSILIVLLTENAIITILNKHQ